MAELVYINGKMVERGEARVSAFDRGLLYGYGLFETMRSYSGRVFRIDRHLSRLARSAEMLGIGAALDTAGLERSVYDTIAANELSDARIRLTVTAGEGERSLSLPTSGSLTTIIVAEELILPLSTAYENGIRATVVGGRRNSRSPLSGLKAIGYLESLLARSQAAAVGADEAVMLNERGLVAECSTSNIFIVASGQLLTPSLESGILPGITRDVIMELASGLGVEASECDVAVADLFNADEVFITNSVIEILPIVDVDNEPIGRGKPGELTGMLSRAYEELTWC
jgi:branched-chain amino acid aminotransferase